MGQYERLSGDQLAATLAALEAEQDIDAGALKRTLHELQVHQVELEMQNRELRETQQLLEESRDRYAQLYDASPVGYVTLDLAGCLQEANSSAHKLLAQQRLQVIGQPLAKWIALADRPKLLAHLTRCRRGGKRVVTELALQPSGGTPVQVLLSSVPDPQEGGASRFLTAVMDITERKAAEEEVKQSREQLRRLTSHVESLRETDRTRIAREIHDELGAALTAIMMDLGWCEMAIAGRRSKEVLERLGEAKRQADAAIASIRRICTDLRPSVLDHLGLVAALEWLAKSLSESSGIPCEWLNTAGEDDLHLTPDGATLLFRVAQEALTNVVRHSGASRMRVSLYRDPEGIGIEVQDNGRGFVPAHCSATESLGLLGMEERVRFLGGQFTIASVPGQGTAIHAHIPCEVER